MSFAPALSTPHLLAALSPLLDYPRAKWIDRIEDVRRLLEPEHPEAAEALALFQAEAAALTLDCLEEIHTRTFSLAAFCVPYVGVQYFGENNFKRGELIARLATELERHGVDWRPELPDYLGNVLKLAPHLTAEQFEELADCCLRDAVTKMHQQADVGNTPYRHIIAAILLILKPTEEETIRPC